MNKYFDIGLLGKNIILIKKINKSIIEKIFTGVSVFSLCFIYFWYLILQGSEQQQLSLVPSYVLSQYLHLLSIRLSIDCPFS